MLGVTANAKLKILESKLDIYEDLSKEMLDKLERAVSSIQDNSNKISIILERHENRLDENDKTNSAILQLVNRVEGSVSELDKKVRESEKHVMTVTITGIAVVGLLQLLPFLGFELTQIKKTSMINSTELVSFVNGSN